MNNAESINVPVHCPQLEVAGRFSNLTASPLEFIHAILLAFVRFSCLPQPSGSKTRETGNRLETTTAYSTFRHVSFLALIWNPKSQATHSKVQIRSNCK
jgi:hypothetical protein